MKVKKEIKKNLLPSILGLLFGIILLPLLLITYQTVSYIFDIVYGEKIVNQILNNITSNLSDIDKISLSIMNWEKEYFYNPYSLWNRNYTLQKYGIYKINGSYRCFVRGSPVSWIIFSKLANCEEYAKVFVYLMNKKGIKSRLVHAPGEDHAWAEYYSEDYKIVVDPSENKTILDKKKFAEGRNWSYIESVDIFNISNINDVSDEYIERGILNIRVMSGNKSVEGVNVIIKSPYLMKVYPERYKKSKIVLINKTNKDGKVFFKLGEKEYIVEVRKSYFIFDIIFSKNVSVISNKEINCSFNLDKDKSELRFLNWLD
ncbi:MAG: transglutaminase domain-containing protein [Candidatus Aenigmarchaeota archaeon]|nr:transglutaminase domain-containing protein [Candidatus Aenigmarchaeota archaeon]